MHQNGFSVQVIKTKVVDVNDETHALPPMLGVHSEFKVADYYCPDEWSKDGVFISVEENEAIWFDFRMNKECACIPSIQKVNPLTGELASLESGLTKTPKQNYLTLPSQMWLDGYANDGKVYQFVITKSGIKCAVSEYVLPIDQQDSNAIGFAFFAPKYPVTQVLSKNYYSEESVKISNYYAYNSSSFGLTPKNLDYTSKLLRCSTQGSTVQGPTVQNSISEANNSLITASDMAYISENNDNDNLLNQTFDKTAMGMGGRIKQAIVTDNNSVDYYKEKPDAVLSIYFVFKDQFDNIMKQGNRNAIKKDKYIFSGKIGSNEIQVPLINIK